MFYSERENGRVGEDERNDSFEVELVKAIPFIVKEEILKYYTKNITNKLG